jgi:hypothetical protein
VLTVKGEVPDIFVKRRALRRVKSEQQPSSATSIIDRVLVSPSVSMDDHSMLSHIRDALLDCVAFRECMLRVAHRGHTVVAQDPVQKRGDIEATIEEGVVTLGGHLPSLVHRRLAGVLTWWVPGTRDVRNQIQVVPPEEDSDEQIREAVTVVLEKEPLVDGSRIGVNVDRAVVTLGGLLRSDTQRLVAMRDALFTDGVEDVVSAIEIDPLA